MVKKQKVKSVLISLFLLLWFSGCGYKFLNKGEKKTVYIKEIKNETFQPKLQIYLSKQLTDTIINFPFFTLISSEDMADYVITIKLYKIDRTPLFYAKENSDEIVNSRLTVDGELFIERGNSILRKKFTQSVSYSLSKSYEEEKILNEITRKIAVKIYSILIENE